MKSLIPWMCLVASAGAEVTFAKDGFDAYRQGDYAEAAQQLMSLSGKDPIADYYMGRMRLYGYGVLKNNTQAVEHYRQSAEKGFLPAQYFMARYQLLREKNPEKALDWFKKAADKNYLPAQMYCAAAYLYGIGTKKNPEIAKRYYIAAAKNGNAIAQAALAEEFINSRHSENQKLGLIWLNKSVEQSNPRAQVALGMLYANGRLVEKDSAKARSLVMAALNQDYVPAMYAMGELARQNNDVEGAKDWFTKAANKNNLPAQVALARLYLDPKSALHDAQTGFLVMLKAAQNGSVDAELAVSDLYKTGQGVEKNEALAKEWQKKTVVAKENPSVLQFKAAQWLTNDKAITLAGSGYRLDGILSPWQNPNALKDNIYNQAPKIATVTREQLYQPQFVMAQPNKIAINEYYNALVGTLGAQSSQVDAWPKYPIDKNYSIRQRSRLLMTDVSATAANANSQTLYPEIDDQANFDILAFLSPPSSGAMTKQAMVQRLYDEAILGDAGAQFTLAQMYQTGGDIEKNADEAIRFYELAAAQKDLPSQYTLGMMYLEGKDVPANYQQALSWLNEAAFRGNAYAQYVLARIYEQGYRDAEGQEVVAPNPEQAMGLYYLSANNQYGVAQYRLAEKLVHDKQSDMSVAAKQRRNQLVKQLYQGAVADGVVQAELPLAFFYAMEADPAKQAQAFATAKKVAARGNAQAAVLLGLMYDRGISVPANQVEAIYWYQQADKNPISAFILGSYFSQGAGVNQDVGKGRALLQQAADAGFSYANLNLAVLKKQQGEPFLPELDTALALGNSQAGLLLADYYLSQGDQAQSMQQARDIYQQFADKGAQDAQLKLAFMFEQGLGGAVDLAAAENWYRLSAEQGQPLAQYLLGHFYQLGGVNKRPNYAEAKLWYEKSKATYAPAAVALGFIYETVDDDYAAAQQNYEYAASRRDSLGQLNLGLIYEKGKGCVVDFAKANHLYQQAAKAGQAQAMDELAAMYFQGTQGTRDEAQALNWYKKSAELGDRNALYQLGLLSETGVTVALDYANAVKYYEKSAALGNTKAMLALARMYQFGIGVNKDAQRAIKIYQDLAVWNNPFAQYQLAVLSLEGNASERKPDVIRKLLVQAENNGSMQARTALQWLDAQTQERVSFIEPARIVVAPVLAEKPADRMYLDALSEWNRGDEETSRQILNRIMTQFPQYAPAKRVYESLQQASLGLYGKAFSA